jgi:hypothetical protein
MGRIRDGGNEARGDIAEDAPNNNEDEQCQSIASKKSEDVPMLVIIQVA